MKIEEKDILGFNFFQYGSPYIGECGGMHFRIARNPAENVVFNHDPHKNDNAMFDVTIWRGPFNYDTTRQKKTTVQFPFTEDGEYSRCSGLMKSIKSVSIIGRKEYRFFQDTAATLTVRTRLRSMKI